MASMPAYGIRRRSSPDEDVVVVCALRVAPRDRGRLQLARHPPEVRCGCQAVGALEPDGLVGVKVIKVVLVEANEGLGACGAAQAQAMRPTERHVCMLQSISRASKADCIRTHLCTAARPCAESDTPRPHCFPSRNLMAASPCRTLRLVVNGELGRNPRS